MAIVALACLAGVGQGYRAVSRSAKRLTKLPRRALRCWVHPDTGKWQVPSEAVCQGVLQAMPRSQIEALAIQWQNELLGPVPATDAVVIDGKEVRGGDVVLVNAIAQPSQRLLGVEPVANALKHLCAKGRPKREATSWDWIDANQFNRWQAIRLIPVRLENHNWQ